MSHRIIDKQLIEIQLQKARMKRAMRIASSIKLRLRINDQTQLGYFLDEPDAVDNLEAITYWVLAEQKRAGVDELPYLELLEIFRTLLMDLDSVGF